MANEPKSTADRSYQMGNIGAGARVAQGENISWVEGVASLPDGESLTRQFDALLKRIASDESLARLLRIRPRRSLRELPRSRNRQVRSAAPCWTQSRGLVPVLPG